MSLKLSTGLANAMLSGSSFRAALDGMVMRIYSGTEPTAADSDIGAAELLVTITDGGGGGALEFEANAVSGVLSKSSSQAWQGTGVADGTATFCRLLLPADTDASSSVAVRLQGDAGLAGRFLNLTSTAISTGAIQRVGALSIAQPLQ
jgi:hypothetical protein